LLRSSLADKHKHLNVNTDDFCADIDGAEAFPSLPVSDCGGSEKMGPGSFTQNQLPVNEPDPFHYCKRLYPYFHPFALIWFMLP
jgi:hypothetical protein